jgi:drug/metabolite transporter (DMT)-like permease
MTDVLLYGSVLLAALAHATWNGLLVNAGDRLLMMAAMRLTGLALGLAIIPFFPLPSRETWPWLVASTLGHFAYYVFLLESYRIGEMSLVYPIARGLAPILLAGISYAFAGERLTPIQACGVGLVCLGILILALGTGGSRRAVLFSIATAFSIAGYTFFGGIGVRTSASVLAYQGWSEVLTSTGFLAFITFKRSRADIYSFLATSRFNGGIAGVIAMAGYFAYLNAAVHLPLAPIAAVRESSVIFGALIGVVAFKEAFGARRIAAAAVVTAGIVALAIFSRPQ